VFIHNKLLKVNFKNTISILIRLLFNLFEFLIVFIILLLFLIRLPFIQNSITKEFTQFLNTELSSEIQFKDVSLKSFKYFQLNELFIPDQNGDTILFAPKVFIDIGKISWTERQFYLDKLVLEKAQLNINKNKGIEKYEFEYLLKSFENNQRKGEKYEIKIKEINLIESRFSHHDFNKSFNKENIDIYNFRSFNLNLLLSNVVLNNNAIYSIVDDLNFQSDFGFEISKLNGNLYLDSNIIKVKNIKIITNNSSIATKEFNYYLNTNNSKLNSELYNFKQFKSVISAVDFNLFSNVQIDSFLKISINSDLTVFNNDFYFEDLSLKYLNSNLNGDLNIKNWNNNLSTSYRFDIKSDQIFTKDLFSLETIKSFRIPPIIKNKLQKINDFKFTFFGTGDNINSSSEFKFISSIGKIYGNLNLLKNEMDEISYNVNLDADNFSGSLIFDELNVENFNAHFQINGKGLYKEDIDLTINGFFTDFIMNNYQYDDVAISGSFKNKAFIGQLQLTDKAIELDFNGNLNLNVEPLEFDFSLNLSNTNLNQLGIISNYPDSKISFNSHFNGFGNDWKDFSGYVNIDDINFTNDDKIHDFGSLQFKSETNNYSHSMNLISDFLTLNIVGDFKFDQLLNNIKFSSTKFLPNLFSNIKYIDRNQSFKLDFLFHKFNMLSDVFYPILKISDNSKGQFIFDDNNKVFDLNLYADKIQFKDIDFHHFNFKTITTNNSEMDDSVYNCIVTIDSLKGYNVRLNERIDTKTTIAHNKIISKINWLNEDSLNLGKINIDVDMVNANLFHMNLRKLNLYDSIIGSWNIVEESQAKFKDGKFLFDTINISNQNQFLSFYGNIGSEITDSFNIDLHEFQLKNIPIYFDFKTENNDLNGLVNSNICFQSMLDNIQFSTNLDVKNIDYNNFEIGDLRFSSVWDNFSNKFIIDGALVNENNEQEINLINASFSPNNETQNRLSGLISLNNTNIDFLNTFLPQEYLSNLNGFVNGDLSLNGTWSQPLINGVLNLEQIKLKLSEYNSSFNLKGELLVTENGIEIQNGNIYDEANISGEITGGYFHNNFNKYSIDLAMNFDNPMLIMNNTYDDNPYYYGKAYISGITQIKYDSINDLSIKVNAKTEKNTDLFIPLYEDEEVVLHDFISFEKIDSNKAEKFVPKTNFKEKLNVDVALEITDEAEVMLIFDDVVGDAMKSTGEGHIQLNIDQNFDVSMYGNYEINKGEYVFALKEFINKKFILNKGGKITWFGDPYNAKIDLSAIYSLRTSLSNIIPGKEKDEWKHKSLVDVYINLENDLMNPDVKFDIDFPKVNESVKTSLESVLSNSEEMNKQVFSLLILNQFITANHLNLDENGKIYDISTSEVLSNQLGNMISSLTDEFDIGFDYSLGNPITNDKLTVAMSTQQFNDRLSIQTNLGMSQSNNSTQNPNTFIGDVNVEYKLNNAGNIRVHAYNESNEYDFSNQNQSNYTQGVGVFYKQSFNSFGELFCEMANLFRLKENKCSNCQDSEQRKIKK
jgi:hypothetical protein